jgi:hypothetical protein
MYDGTSFLPPLLYNKFTCKSVGEIATRLVFNSRADGAKRRRLGYKSPPPPAIYTRGNESIGEV